MGEAKLGGVRKGFRNKGQGEEHSYSDTKLVKKGNSRLCVVYKGFATYLLSFLCWPLQELGV